jgi:uncharacterized membrane protein
MSKDGKNELEELKNRLDENEAGALAYSLGLITGILFFFIYDQNDFVQFHAGQSIIVFSLIIGMSFIINIAVLSFTIVPVFGEFLGQLLGILQQGLGITALILWILLMFKAYQGKRYELPVLGEVVDMYKSE